MPPREIGGGRLAAGLGYECLQHRALSWSERPPTDGPVVAHRRRGLATLAGQADHAFVARSGSGAQQGPLERDGAGGRQHPESPQQAGAAIGRGQVPDRARPAIELLEQVGVDRVARVVGVRRGAAGHRDRVRGPLRHELQPLEQPGWQHRPDDQRRRGEVVRRDLPRQREAQGWQQRTVCPNPVEDRPRLDRGRRRSRAQHDPERLPPPELHEDGLPDLQVGQLRRHEVRVGLGAGAGRVDRDLDQPGGRGDRGAGVVQPEGHRPSLTTGRGGSGAGGARPR